MRRMLLGLALVSVMATSNAATIMGTDVIFDYDDTTLFGTANVIGNNIFFLPTTFLAESTDLDGAVNTSDTLNITITVKAGSAFNITDFLWVEDGDYELQGSSASVSANGRLQVTSGTKLCPGPLPGFDVPCEDSEIFNVGGLTTTGALTEWDAAVAIALADTAGWLNDTSVVVQIQNNLNATSTVLGDSAEIQKKSTGIGLIINPIPVPGAVWLFGSALGLLGWMRRRHA